MTDTSARIDTVDGDAKLGRMRFLVRATISVAIGNEQKTNPALAGRLQRALQWVDADDYYFVIEHGKRCIYFFLTVAGSHEVPKIAEALWLGLDAEVEFLPAISQSDFERGRAAVDEVVASFLPSLPVSAGE
ncbi:MAG TPA: hypothetical protein VNN79_05630 [Actinomycetota bacterium]|nr:hypothetical protein [Actinomycetota bacterium]